MTKRDAGHAQLAARCTPSWNSGTGAEPAHVHGAVQSDTHASSAVARRRAISRARRFGRRRSPPRPRRSLLPRRLCAGSLRLRRRRRRRRRRDGDVAVRLRRLLPRLGLEAAPRQLGQRPEVGARRALKQPLDSVLQSVVAAVGAGRRTRSGHLLLHLLQTLAAIRRAELHLLAAWAHGWRSQLHRVRFAVLRLVRRARARAKRLVRLVCASLSAGHDPTLLLLLLQLRLDACSAVTHRRRLPFASPACRGPAERRWRPSSCGWVSSGARLGERR